ncbi:group II intron maturase-specific domain-containing protein [Nonomuraea sp. 3N208]|uniref:group II intron maturase-specific domain-containing protein n=1 Tax=Nonomuraea sp. 3N208 TaxID=3457421 RepID=UPI003FD60CF2
MFDHGTLVLVEHRGHNRSAVAAPHQPPGLTTHNPRFHQTTGVDRADLPGLPTRIRLPYLRQSRLFRRHAARTFPDIARYIACRLERRPGFKDIAKLINVKAGPWAAYFGRFRPSGAAHVLSHIDQYLVRWARRKYKHLRRSPRRAWETLKKIMKSHPGLFAHWKWNALRRSVPARAG